MKNFSGRTRILTLVILALAVVGGLFWRHGLSRETTDDAFIERHVLYVKPRIQGVIIELPVADNQLVKEGDLLARLDPAPFRAAVDAAKADVASAQTLVVKAKSEQQAFFSGLSAREQNAQAGIQVAREDLVRQRAELTTLDAQIEQSKREVARYTQLQARQQVSKQQLEESSTELDTLLSKRKLLEATVRVADAQVSAADTQFKVIQSDKQQTAVYEATVEQADAALKAAQAALETAELQLSWTEMRAPHAGVISKIQSRVGAQIDPATSIGILVYGNPWVQANFKETQIGSMRAGDTVAIKVDAYPGETFQGHVESFQAGTGARFSLLPPENATGNFVKVVQRVPVKIVFDELPKDDFQLWPGMSAIPTVHLSR